MHGQLPESLCDMPVSLTGLHGRLQVGHSNTASFAAPVINEKEMEGTQTRDELESASVAALFRRPVIGP